jgi:predicted 3-demethylubiquinone-9 3-methyltransferase (glyoxalase superfamily)
MPKIVPCLWFDGQGEEAAEFYTSVFPNSKITEVVRYGKGVLGKEGAVMTVSFSLDGQEYLALNGGPQFTFSEAISLQIHCTSQEEVDDYWAKLTAGGGEEGPCGWLKDRYGLSWQVVPTALLELGADPDRDRADRAMQAMMRMGKIDIAELYRAAGQTSPA